MPLTAILVCLAGALIQPEPAPPTPTPTPAPAPAPAPASAEYADAKDLLIALESADAGLDQFWAEIRYDVNEVDVDDRTVRLGELSFDRVKEEKSGKTVRRFAVKFTTLLVGTSQRSDLRIHAFDGRWYAEKSPEARKINRKEVVPPGESFDPLKIGEGPLPIPIGQKPEDILSRYDAELRPLEEGLDAREEALRAFVKGCVQVKLTPKRELRDRDRFKEIRLWYRGKRPEKMSAADPASDRLLPRLARTVGQNGNITLVQLGKILVNADAKIDKELMSTAAPAGWDVTETPFRAAAPAEPAVKPESAPAGAGKAEEKKGPASPEPAKPDAPK